MVNSEDDLKLTATKEPRGAARAAMREESPQERAKKRAEQIRQHRAGVDLDEVNRFYFDPSIIPDGWTYEWKRKTLMGQEDPAYQVRLAEAGWEAVPTNRCPRHAALMPQGNYPTIERDGMILMERPKELTDEARDVEYRRARNQVRAKEAQLSSTPEGTMTREHDRVRPSIKKGYEPMAVPKD